MAGPMINTGSISQTLLPTVKDFVGMGYNRHPEEYSQIFDVMGSQRAIERFTTMYGFGPASVIPEGTDVAYDYMGQGFTKDFMHTKYGKAFSISEEAIDDCLYPEVAKFRADNLGFSLRQTVENVHALILDRANNSAYTGIDGVELSSSVHVKARGGTYSNELATASELSEASLEQAMIDIGGFEDDASTKLMARGMKLIVPRQLEYEAKRILESTLRPGTANNDINVVGGQGLDLVMNHYLSSSTKWFLKTDIQQGLISLLRKPMTVSDDTDFNSKNLRFMVSMRFVAGWVDPRGIFCNGE